METTELLGTLKETREALQKSIEKRDEEIKKNGKANEATGKKVDDLFERMEKMEGEVSDAFTKSNRPGLGGRSGAKSVGAQFTESEAYKQARQMGLKSTEAVEVKASDILNVKALDSTDTGGNLLGETYRDPTMVTPMDEFLTMRDMMRTRQTTAGQIEWVEETGFTNAAAPVPEGTAKPESALEYTKREAGTKTVAHGLPATNQVLADATQLQDQIDGRLRYGLQVAEERQILYGTGVGEQYQGLLTNANRQQYQPASDSTDTKIDTLRRAMTRVRLAEYPSQGIVFHPIDWEDIELIKGSDGRYLIASYNQGGERRFFRVPAVESTAIAEGEAVVGAFNLAATLYNREAVSVRVFEQHSNFAELNMVYIRAEMRGLLVNYRPEAFCHVTFANAAATV